MNTDFARIITLLRKEKKISQKQAAEDMGVSQGLLSHYENGKRECGLDFVVRAAEYYNVSCDYLLGRSPEPEGKTISVDELPGEEQSQRDRVSPGTIMVAFNKKLIQNSLNVVFGLMGKTGSATVIKEGSGFIMLAVYKLLRCIFSSNPENDENFFGVDSSFSESACDAAMSLAYGRLRAASRGVSLLDEDSVKKEQRPRLGPSSMADDFPQYYSSTVNLIKNSEARLKSLESLKQ
ncbi:MAG TPA: helix-turn-helix transcriptional regulator [Candidatus Faeciplasma avium]|uniref:Helix-turn-helix transcriptional regulator n=1 Tax=Candidatus Faeciplasma avium TaxID=2840798 RepID=A0A9D1T437_9FIRM|nr:helix-turn-helix transcriptional regulator [Candidatus Faeciplasma avium]